MSATLEALVPGTFGWELIDLIASYINDKAASKILEIQEDKLMVNNCKELGRHIVEIVDNDLEPRAHVYLSGYDFRHVINKVTVAVGLPSRSNLLDIIRRYGEILYQEGRCMPAFTSLYAIPAMLNVNFYEYGKGYIKKPTKRLKPKTKISGGAMVLGYLGGLLCYAGSLKTRKAKISFYFLPDRRIINWFIMKDIIGGYWQLIDNNYSDPAILLFLISTLFKGGVTKSDAYFGRMITIQEGKRAALLSVNSMHTIGLIKMLSKISKATNLKNEMVASKLISFIKAPMSVRGDERDALMNLVDRVSTYLLAYASTESPEPLSMLVSLLDRVLGEFQAGSSSSLSNGLRAWASLKGSSVERELRFLIELFSSMRRV